MFAVAKITFDTWLSSNAIVFFAYPKYSKKIKLLKNVFLGKKCVNSYSFPLALVPSGCLISVHCQEQKQQFYLLHIALSSPAFYKCASVNVIYSKKNKLK